MKIIGRNYTIKVVEGPSWVDITEDKANIVTYPKTCQDISEVTVKIRLEDDNHIGNNYTTKIKVLNLPPKYELELPKT